MKKIILFTLITISSNFLMGQFAPVAVDDTTHLSLGEFVTVNVTQNDYHPGGRKFWVKSAPGSFSFTDNTITYYADYDRYFGINNDFVYKYVLIDEDGYSYQESVGYVYVYYTHGNVSKYLDTNNIRAKINPWGMQFWQGPTNIWAAVYPPEDTVLYEYPKGSIKNTIFNENIWVGGMDENGQFRLAAERYCGIGKDFWEGPLSISGSEVSIDTSTVMKWHRVWKLNVDQIIYHKNHWKDSGYQPIEAIATWPAHGDPKLNQADYLAPFVDVDGDSIYDPMKGDYPLIRGDQCIFFIYNDVREHTETQGKQIGLEIHGMAYEFYNPDTLSLNNTVFFSYKIFNRSGHTLNDTYIGVFCDFEIGYAFDDYVGCDVGRGAFYGYNGEDIDGNGEPHSYGENPPAQGIVILGGPLMDPNNQDDPVGGCDESINGVGFGDGIVDNERFGMTKFIYFNNSSGVQGDPFQADEYYNYMKAIWKDSTAMEYGGNGHIASGAYGPAANFMFPGLTDPCYWGTGGEKPYGPVDWTEETAGNRPDDRRGLSVMGPFTFLPGSVQKVDLAFVTARGDDGPYSSVELLKQYIDEVKQGYYKNSDYYGYQWLGEKEHQVVNKNTLKVFPNPATTEIWVDYPAGRNQVTYCVFDIYGRQIRQGVINSEGPFSISMTGMQKGLYVVTVQDGNTIYTVKVMKE